MKVEIDGNVYEVEIVKKNNRNTYIRVRNGRIIVTTNYLTSKRSIEKLILDNTASIRKMIGSDNKQMDRAENCYYFGKQYDVIYGFDDIEVSGNKIYASNKSTLDRYFKQEIISIYQKRLDYWYSQFEERIPYPNLKIRKMTSRWGVCNVRNHNVTLNYNLVKYDICCLDYVIVHELSHFIHHNHSKDFWLMVAKYYPEYRKCKKMLKE